MNDKSSPALSVLIVAPKLFSRIRKTLRTLKAQTIKDRLEIIVVVPSADSAGVDESELSGFFGYQVVEVGPIHSVDRAAARSVKHATATVVAIIEDHAFPNPQWAEAIVAAHQNPWAAVGPAVENANPETTLSWMNFLTAYGKWGGATGLVVVDDLPRHNVSYKRSLLLELGTELENIVGRAGSLHENFRAKGHRFVMEPAAHVHHLNPSRLSSTIGVRFQTGRMFGAMRAHHEKWSFFRRVLYIVALPLIPAINLPRILGEVRVRGRQRELLPRILPALLFGLVLEALGEVVGYAFGAGSAPRFLDRFELDRFEHLTASDKRQLRA